MDDHVFKVEGVSFGLHQPVAVEQSGFQPGSALADEDTTWVFEGFLDTTDEPVALDALAQMRRLWSKRRLPGEWVALSYGLGGRTRRVYGRPQKWDQAVDNRILGGGGGLSFEFKTLDWLHYDDDEKQHVLTIAPASLGGFPVPFTTPWTSVHSSQSERSFIVGGDTGSPFEVTFTGPLTNGWVSGGNWRIELNGTINDNESLTVCTYPWSYGVTKDGAAAAGILAATTTRLSQARLDPNGETVAFGGTSSSGTATATIRWRPAWLSI